MKKLFFTGLASTFASWFVLNGISPIINSKELGIISAIAMLVSFGFVVYAAIQLDKRRNHANH